MCHPPDNSLESNLAAQAEMLRSGIVTLDRMPKLTADAENAERTYRNLMQQTGCTPEELLRITGYRLSTTALPISNLAI